MQVAINKLKGKIVERGTNVKEVSAKIGVNPSTFYRKLHEKGTGFTLGEMYGIIDFLNISPKEALSIFFTD